MCVPILIQQIKVKTQVLILWQNEFCLKRHCAPDFLTCTELCMLKVNLTKMNLYVKFLEGKVIFKYCLILYNQIINRQNLFNIYQEIYKICYCFVHFPHMHWIHVYSKLLRVFDSASVQDQIHVQLSIYAKACIYYFKYAHN